MTGETVMLSDMKTSLNVNEKSFFTVESKPQKKLQ
jgi:hypothetical protein